jgi:ubiquinol-cytochrome c reductase iron-sulfur subunit
MSAPASRTVRVLAGVSAVAVVVGVVAAVALHTTATAAAWSIAALSAAAALGVRTSRSGQPVVVPQHPAAVEVPEHAARPVRVAARRAFLAGTAAVGAAVLGVSGTVGGVLLARAAPRRPEGTSWRRGVYAVTTEGRRLHVDDVPPGGIATVWPEGAVGDPRSPVLLVTLTRTPVAPPGVQAWVVEGRVAGYSKICTHARCAVGLFSTDADILYCPCHQAMFDAARGAVPVFGPASKPLPQLPLGADADGFLIATEDFAVPVGPPDE